MHEVSSFHVFFEFSKFIGVPAFCTRSTLKNVSGSGKCGPYIGFLTYYQTKPVYFSANTVWAQSHRWHVVIILA